MAYQEVGSSFGLDSDTSHPGTHSSVAPFAIMLLVLFLGLDACERIGELFWVAWQATKSLESPINPYPAPIPVTVLWIVVDVLLPILLLLRTQAGRLLTQVIFGIHLIYLAHVFVLKHPYLWLYMGSLGRAKLVVTILIDGRAIGYLFSRQARLYLDR